MADPLTYSQLLENSREIDELLQSPELNEEEKEMDGQLHSYSSSSGGLGDGWLHSHHSSLGDGAMASSIFVLLGG